MRTTKYSIKDAKKRFPRNLFIDIVKNKYIYIMAIPVLAYYVIFCYWPMYGAIIAFKNFSPAKGILDSPWVGFKYFHNFFTSFYFFRLLRNTLLLSVFSMLFSFPTPILFALLLNEIKNTIFKKTVQTVTYLPHFISTVIICGMLVDFLSKNGLINMIISAFGVKPISFLSEPQWFRPIYIGSDMWQELGWGTIIFLAALSAVDPQQYDAASIDGAGRLRQALHVTIPGMMPTIIILLILRLGSMMSVGFEKIILLYNGNTYETADVISTFVYRRGILQMDYSYSSAIGLFNSVINFILLIMSNKICRKVQDTSLW